MHSFCKCFGEQQPPAQPSGLPNTGFEDAQGVMNQEVKFLLDSVFRNRKDNNTGWQPSKVALDAQDYVNKLPWAANHTVINDMRG